MYRYGILLAVHGFNVWVSGPSCWQSEKLFADGGTCYMGVGLMGLFLTHVNTQFYCSCF